MYFLILGCIVIIATVLQSTFLNFIQVWEIKPDLVLTIIALNGFFKGPTEGAWGGIGAGLICDIVSGTTFGLGAAAGFLAGYAGGLAESRFFKDNRFIAAGVIFFVSLAGELAIYIMLSFSGIKIPSFLIAVKIVVFTSLYNSIIVFLFYRRIYKGFNSLISRYKGY